MAGWLLAEWPLAWLKPATCLASGVFATSVTLLASEDRMLVAGAASSASIAYPYLLIAGACAEMRWRTSALSRDHSRS